MGEYMGEAKDTHGPCRRYAIGLVPTQQMFSWARIRLPLQLSIPMSDYTLVMAIEIKATSHIYAFLYQHQCHHSGFCSPSVRVLSCSRISFKAPSALMRWALRGGELHQKASRHIAGLI